MKILRSFLLAALVFAFFGSSASALGAQPGALTGEAVEGWRMPFEVPTQLVNEYRQPSSEYSAGHRGVDYLVSLNQEVLAPARGQVRFVGRVVDRNLISLSHPGGEITEFEPVCSDLIAGEQVEAGQIIGWVCDPSIQYRQHCTNLRCLHFSLRKADMYLSPLALIGGLNPSRLLPVS